MQREQAEGTSRSCWDGGFKKRQPANQREVHKHVEGGAQTPCTLWAGSEVLTWGRVLGKTATPRGKGGRKWVTVNGWHDWEGQDSQGTWQTGSGGTSAGSWEQNICHFGL